MLIWQLIMRFIELNRRNKILRRFTAACAAITVFITTYAMILPAISLERMAADEMPGFVLEENLTQPEVSEELTSDDGAEEPVRALVARTFTATVTGAAISVTFADAADFDEDLELHVEEVSADVEEERYTAYANETASALAAELPMPEGDAAITAANFYQIHFEHDHEVIIPTGSAIVLIQPDDMSEDAYRALGAVSFEGTSAQLHVSGRDSKCNGGVVIKTDTLTADVIGIFEAPQFAGETLTYDGADYAVQVVCPAFSGVVSGSALAVREITEEDDSYLCYRTKIDERYAGQKILGARYFDITISDENGNKIQPALPVEVTVTLRKPLEAADASTQADRQVQVIHFEEKQAEEEIITPVRASVKKALSANVKLAEIQETLLPEITAMSVMDDVNVSIADAGAGQIIRFNTDGFSVYAIIDHEGGTLITPRLVFHYINYNFTEDASGVFSAGPYNFKDKSESGDTLWTQILKDGETLDEVPTPPVFNSMYFNGWYVVDKQSDTTSFNTTTREYIGTVRYTVPNDPTRQTFGQAIPINQGAEDASGIPILWTMNGKEYRDYADSEGRVHVYLAPLYANFNYVNFYDFDGNLIARKMLVLDSNGFASMMVSDLEATSPVNGNDYFMGWSTAPYNPGNDQQTGANTLSLYEDGYKKTVYITLYRAAEGADIAVYEGIYADASALEGHTSAFTVNTDSSGGNVNLYAEYERAHWLRFIAGETGWGSMYVPADYLVGDAAATHLPTTTRTGYTFAGWYSGYQDTDGHIHYYEQVSDENGTVLTDSATEHLIEAASGTGDAQITTLDQYGNPEDGTVNVNYTGAVDADGKLTMTKDSYLYAMWTSNATATYKVIIWQQRVGNTLQQTLTPVEYANWIEANPDASDEEKAEKRAITKTYDFYNSFRETADALTTVTLPASSDYLNYNFTGFHLAENNDTSVYGVAAYEQDVVIDPQGTSVINVYYDRNVHTYTFEVLQTGYNYSRTTSEVGDQYGFQDGQYGELTYTDGQWYIPGYGYHYEVDSEGEYIKLDNDTYAELIPVYGPVEMEVPVYQLTDTLSAGNDYLIVSTNSVGRGYALGHNGGIIRANSVDINGEEVLYIYEEAIAAANVSDSIWNVTGSYYFRNGNYYLRRNNNTLQASTTSTSWTWDGINNYLSSNSRYVYYNGSNFGLRNNVVGNVYLYVKTTITEERLGIVGYNYVDKNGITQSYNNEQKYAYVYGPMSVLYDGARYTPLTRGYRYNPVYIITDLYGNNIASHFPFTYGADGDDYSDARWTAEDSSVWDSSMAMVYIDTMTDEDVTFYHSAPGTRPVKTMLYYVEILDGEEAEITLDGIGYKLYKTVNARYNYVSSEDLTPITGYTYLTSSDSTFNRTGQTTSSSSAQTFRFFYTRNNYTLTFSTNYPGDAQFTSGASASENHIEPNVPYEALLTPYGNAAPNFTAPDHYIFDGWYEDQSCTVPFDFSQTMPAANKVIYAKWYPVYYLIQIDPNGGVIAGMNSQNESTYFWLQYGTTIGQYATSRAFLETTAEEAAEKGAEIYYYRYVRPTINANGTVLEHSAWSGSNVATLWGSDLDSEKDNEGIRPAFYRMAEYVKVSDYHTANDVFYQYMVANGSQAIADAWDAKYVDTTRIYRPIMEGDPTWSFVGWYKDDAPYDFTSAVTEDVTLKAVWRLSGDYYLYYNPRMEIEGVVGTLSGAAYDPVTPSQTQTSEGYIDKATTHVKTAPNDIHGINQDTSGNTYIFEGWRVVGPNGNPLDENGHVMTEAEFLADAERYLYQPGDEIVIRSEQAHISNTSGRNIIELRAYYRKVEDSSRYPDVVQLILDANTAYSGYLDPDATAWPVWAEPGHSAVDTEKTAEVNGQYYQIAFGDAQENQAIHLTNYRPFFVNSEGHFLLGFDPQSNPENCENGAYIPKYAADAVIGIDEPGVENILYAIWEPMVYVSFVNYTGAPVTISLNSLEGETSIEATVVNNATQTYERTAISAMNSVTVASGQTIRLVIPKGSGKGLNLSLANNHIGFKMSATKQVGDNPASDLFGGELETPAPLEYGQSYTYTQPLITSFTGIIYTLTEKPLDYAYFDVNGGQWMDSAHTAASQAAANADKPFWQVTEAGVYHDDYQIAINNFIKPSDPTAPANTQFLGWTTDEYVAQIRDFSLTIDQMTERRNAAAPGSRDYLLYDHLINLIGEYKAAYGITEVTNLLQVVEAYSLWNFSNPPAGTVYYAVYAELATVRYHLMYVSGTYNSNHHWGLDEISGNPVTSEGQLGTVYTRSTFTEADNRTHYIWSRQVVKGRSIIKPVAPTYGGSEGYTFLYWLKDDSTHTNGSTTPSTVTAYSFVEPITGNLDLYTSWTGGYRTTLTVTKNVLGALSKTSDGFNFRYNINTYRYTFTGGTTSRTLYHSDSTGISLAGNEDRDINLFYWTDAEGNLYAQSVEISETGLASSGYELTITDGEGRTSAGSKDAASSLIYADNSTGANYYRFYPVSNHAVEDGSNDYYMKGVSEKEQMTVWHFTKGNYDLYFWNNNWYTDLQCTSLASSSQIPHDAHTVTFTNEKDARVRFIKVDENGFDRLNGAEFTLTKIEGNAPVTDPINLITGYVRTKDETSGRNGRFILAAGVTIPESFNVRMDTDKNELVFMETGTYRLTETKAPDGYYLPSEFDTDALDYVDITVTVNGIMLAGNASVASEVALSQLNIGEFDNDNEYAVVIQNKPKQASFIIQKVDTSGNPIVNGAASFTVTGTASASGNYVNLGTISTVPENYGKTVVQTVPYGTYTASETAAPTGYRLADDTIITVGDNLSVTGNNVYDGGTISGTGMKDDPYIIRIQDEQTGYNLTLREVDVNAPTSDKPPEYTITVTAVQSSFTESTSPANKTYNLVTTDADNNSTNSPITFDANGEAQVTIRNGLSVTLRSLPAGDYIVTEAEGGYSTHVNVVEPSTSHVLANKNANTATFALSTATTATFTNTYGVPVKIVLTGSSNPAKPLAGATFSLAGGDINETSLTSTLRTVTSSTGSVTEALIYETSVLPAGEYTLTQTGMVDGYIPLEGPVTIRVTSSESGMSISAILSGSGMPFSAIKDTNTGVWTITITNQTGYALPSTGGKGTMSYYVFAGLCFVLAGVLMILRRRNRTASCIS